MLRNKYHGLAGSGGSDVVALGGNMRRKSLAISYQGAGYLIVALGRSTAAGTDGDFTVIGTGGSLLLTEAMIGDAIHDDVHLWNSAAGGPCDVVEFFAN